MKNIVVSLVFSLTLLAAGSTLAAVKKIGDTVVDAKALNLGDPDYGATRFAKSINSVAVQQDAMVTHEGYQYIGYYDSNRKVSIARRKLPLGQWQVISFDDYKFKNNDAHNTISIGISPANGTIHMAFDHHGDPLHYRVSVTGAATSPATTKWEASLFGPIVSQLQQGKKITKITYPKFWQTPDGALQFSYRHKGAGNGIRMLVDYDPNTSTWGKARPIDSKKGAYGKSSSRCSYPNGYTYGPKGNLHTTWVWRERTQTGNHDLMYAYSEDGGTSWLNNNGEKLAGPAAVDSPGITVVTIPEQYGLMNTHGQAVDTKGRIHTVMWHTNDESLQAAGSKPGAVLWGPPEARRYFHYFRTTDGSWETRELPGVAGTRPKVFFDQADNAYLIFQKAGDLIIMGATASTTWNDWQVIHTEKGPFGNEMLLDFYRWKQTGILSILAQESPQGYEPTPLRIIDFQLR